MNRLKLSVCVAFLGLWACDEKKSATPAAQGSAPATPAAAAPKAEAPKAAAIEVPQIVISTAQPDIDKGKEVFAAKGCPACHKMGGGKLVGPDLKGVTARRSTEWLVKMILKPDLMVKEDPEAKKLFAEYMLPMPNQNVDAVKDLPFIMAYLKSAEN
jgi:mono/diheme cytochrome c family protein